MVKGIPTKITGELKFPVLKEGVKEDLQTKYAIKGLSELKNGFNQGALISGKIVAHLAKDQEVPMCFLVVDHQYNFCVVSLYKTNKSITDKIGAGDHIWIKNPQYIFTSIDCKGKNYSYNSIKIDWLADVLVKGLPLVE
jgi:hypothetical protein